MKAMKPLVLIAAAIFACWLAALPAHAQETPWVYAIATASYDATCNCATLSGSFVANTTATEDYALSFLEMGGDDDNTASFTSYAPGAFPFNNVPLNDTFEIEVSVNGTLYPGAGGGEYGCSCCCSSGCYCSCGGNCCGFIGPGCPGPQGPRLPSYLAAGNSAVTGTGTCSQGADLDNLLNEYWHPTAVGLPATRASAWQSYGIDCGSFHALPTDGSEALPEYSNPYAFSPPSSDPGDYTDWAIFGGPMVSAVEGQINNPALWQSFTPTDITSPISVAVPGDIYRTPAYSNDQGHASNEPHQFGMAIDFAAGTQQKFNDIAAWSEYAVGNNAGETTVSYVCLEPGDEEATPYSHVHVDWRPEAGQACATAWQEDYIPTGWASH